VADNEPAHCSICGRRRDPAAADQYCRDHSRDELAGQPASCSTTCARAHVRDIEGKLPAEYW